MTSDPAEDKASNDLLEQFKAALAAENAARDAVNKNRGNRELLDQWLRSMDATNDASRKLRESTRE